jgi:nitrogen fixation NifU-like protein
MEDLAELYQELILDHNRTPHNCGRLQHATHHAEGYNPLCGDRVFISLEVGPDSVINDVRFDGKGCAISTASASLMTDAVKGHTAREVAALFQQFQQLVTSDKTPDAAVESLGKLAALAGVRKYPVRVKCATLAWHTLLAAIENSSAVISTE